MTLIFNEVIPLDIFTRLIFAACHIMFYNPYFRNYWRELYFQNKSLSRCNAKITSSQIKIVLKYLYFKTFDFRCQQVHCEYEFFKQARYYSIGRDHQMNIYWDDINVVLLGKYTVNTSFSSRRGITVLAGTIRWIYTGMISMLCC